MITRKQLIEKYLEFFRFKGHKIIPNESLIPKNDPTVLFTTAGMHPLVPYLLGQRHTFGKRLAGNQRCIRTTDIDSVGDAFHHTFFEMLGNWSLGDYWKKEAIEMSFEFLTKILGINSKKISVTCFKGDKSLSVPRDTESADAWQSLGIKKVRFLGKEDNWWGPAGKTGPCGPDTEMFIKDSSGKELEIWNDVFMQYNKTSDGKFLPLQQKNVDTGMGVERTLAVLNGLNDDYITEVFLPIIKRIERLSGKKYKGNEKAMRIIADHIKAAVFITAEGVLPSNIGQGYVLRRLIRRTVRFGRNLGLKNFTGEVAEPVFEIYHDYMELRSNRKKILKNLTEEEEKFNKTLQAGLNVFNEIANGKSLSSKQAFLLYQSYGFPVELTEEIAKERGIKLDMEGFEEELKKHQELSRTASAGVFKSGLADHSVATTRLHTATHLLNQALRAVLGPEVKQRGSNITPERLRFDFSFPRKLTDGEISKVENLVNDKIKQGLPVISNEMKLKDALKSGAQAEFGAKYPEIVSVYSIGDFSREICTGP
ncbi:MAG: alanine--tRNA ligase, partial [Nanoarchaeota archaeon]